MVADVLTDDRLHADISACATHWVLLKRQYPHKRNEVNYLATAVIYLMSETRDSAHNGSRNSSKNAGKQVSRIPSTSKRDDTKSQLGTFWQDELRNASEEIGGSTESLQSLMEQISKRLEKMPHNAELSSQLADMARTDVGEIAEQIAVQKQEIARVGRNLAKHTKQLKNERDRLKGYKRARLLQEQEEADEMSSKLHDMAKSILEGGAAARKVHPNLRAKLNAAKATPTELALYKPEDDAFLLELATKLSRSVT